MVWDPPEQIQEALRLPRSTVEEERNSMKYMKEERPSDTRPNNEGETGREGSTQMILMPASVWQQMVTAIEKLTQEQEKIQKEYKILCDQVKQCSQHVKFMEPKDINKSSKEHRERRNTPPKLR